MTKIAVGLIPEQICYVSSNEQAVKVGCEWDIDWEDGKYISATEKVLPTFPTDAHDQNMLAKAKDWASRSLYIYKDGKSEEIERTATTTVVDNIPIKNIRLLSLEKRGEGGRAYKALIDKFYVDFREDVLMDTILKAGIDIGGILQGEYIWAKMRGQMRLVRVGSELHKLLLEFEDKKHTKPVANKDLIVGGIYKGRQGNEAIFLGFGDTVEFTGYSDDFKLPQKQHKNMLVFLTYHHVKKNKEEINWDEYIRVDIKKSHTYIEKVGQIKIYYDPFEKIRHHFEQELINSMNYVYSSQHGMQNHLRNSSKELNLYPTGTVGKIYDIVASQPQVLKLPPGR